MSLCIQLDDVSIKYKIGNKHIIGRSKCLEFGPTTDRLGVYACMHVNECVFMARSCVHAAKLMNVLISFDP